MHCPVCGMTEGTDYRGLADHFVEMADASDPDHVMWLNRNVTDEELGPSELAMELRDYEKSSGELAEWLKSTFIDRFLGADPHPFVEAHQHPSRAVLLGYVVEHQHFLRQWVRSCANILAKTRKLDATYYEIENINTEFGDEPGGGSHYDLLLEAGESLGLSRGEIVAAEPLPATKEAIKFWDRLARDAHWVESMAAMHGLELIANHELLEEGAEIAYFDPAILEEDEYPEAVKAFLREGYEADVGHSEEALVMVDRYAREFRIEDDVRSTFQESIDHFDRYLNARLERAAEFEQ